MTQVPNINSASSRLKSAAAARPCLLLAAWAVLCPVGQAQGVSKRVSPGAGVALSVELIALRTEGWEAAYRTDYETARAKFAELQRRAPNHPEADLSMASIIWQEYLFKTRRLQSSVYHRDSNFYAGARSAAEGSEGEAVEAAVDRAFQEHITRGVANAQSLVDSNPNDPEALYFLGSAYGVRAAYEASAQRRFWAAIRDGLRAAKLHQKVLALDSTFYDAYLIVGIYHYAIGCVPQPFRAIATMAGIRGSKSGGIAELELATKKAAYNRDDARSVLIALYRYEGSPQRAYAELETLSNLYPQSVLLRLEMASTLAQLGKPASAAAMFEELLQGPDRRLTDLVEYQYAEMLAQNRSYADAARHFAAVEQTPDAYPALVTQSLLRAGQMHDLLGRRPEAIRFYRATLSRPTSPELRRRAEQLIRQPYKLK